jgi:hypothetical protein
VREEGGHAHYSDSRGGRGRRTAPSFERRDSRTSNTGKATIPGASGRP